MDHKTIERKINLVEYIGNVNLIQNIRSQNDSITEWLHPQLLILPGRVADAEDGQLILG